MNNMGTVQIYALLILPCIFSSALILPELFAPFRMPLYLMSVVTSFFFIKNVPTELRMLFAYLVLILFFAALISGFWVNESQFAVNFRQWLLYVTLFWCGLIGAISYRLVSRVSSRYSDHMLLIFIILFGYGIYTYYAQLFNLPEFLYLLRPNPDLRVEVIYSQEFVGWASAARAYSVWFEPSFSAIVVACALPLLYLPSNRKLKVLFALFALPYIYLTYSRSTWMVAVFFVFAHGIGLFKIRMNQVGLLFFALSISAGLTIAQVYFANVYDEQSSLIRIYSVVHGILEWIDNPLFGSGQAELLAAPTILGEDIEHIHASIPIMLHWYGILGLIVALIPFWSLAAKGSGRNDAAQTSFIYLTIIAITVGGALMMMSIFWFFWGFLMAQKKDWR
jgi:hypothetical protein